MTMNGQGVACIWMHYHDDVLNAIINYIFIEIQRSHSWVRVELLFASTSFFELFLFHSKFVTLHCMVCNVYFELCGEVLCACSDVQRYHVAGYHIERYQV